MVEKVMNCIPWGVKEDLKGIAKICIGCKQFHFSKEWGFTCGWGGWKKRALEQNCSVCGKTFEAKLGAYFGEVEGVEYWECPKCESE